MTEFCSVKVAPHVERNTREAALGRLMEAKSGPTDGPGRREQLIRDLVWGIVSVSMHLEEIRNAWAELLGLTGSQFLILIAVNDLDTGGGISVGETAKRLHVDSSFITLQTKNLEKRGFVSRTISAADARVVLMSTTDWARKQIEALSLRQKSIDDFVFSGLSDQAIQKFGEEVSLFRVRLEKVVPKIAAES